MASKADCIAAAVRAGATPAEASALVNSMFADKAGAFAWALAQACFASYARARRPGARLHA